MPVIPVDASDPRLNPFRNLRSQVDDASGFVVEGAWLVERLAKSRFPVDSVLTGVSQSEHTRKIVGPNVPIYQLPTKSIRDVVGFHFHRGVLARARRMPEIDLRSAMADQIITEPLRLLICPEIQNDENLGSLLRTSAAFGLSGALLGSGCPDPLGRRVIRVSMGAAFDLPVFKSRELSADIQWLINKMKLSLVATVIDDQTEKLNPQTKINGNWGLMVGREDTGLPPAWSDHCTRRLTICMPGGSDSLNVAVATAIVLYQLTV